MLKEIIFFLSYFAFLFIFFHVRNVCQVLITEKKFLKILRTKKRKSFLNCFFFYACCLLFLNFFFTRPAFH